MCNCSPKEIVECAQLAAESSARHGSAVLVPAASEALEKLRQRTGFKQVDVVNRTHARAAELVGDYLPEYMATWIRGVLRETHTLPALIEHQDKLALDVLSIAVVQHDEPDDREWRAQELRDEDDATTSTLTIGEQQ